MKAERENWALVRFTTSTLAYTKTIERGAYMRHMYIAQVHGCMHILVYCMAKHVKSVLELFNFFFANLFLSLRDSHSPLFSFVYLPAKVLRLNMWKPLVAVGPTLIKFQISRKVFLIVCSLIHSFISIHCTCHRKRTRKYMTVSRCETKSHIQKQAKRTRYTVCVIKVE